MKFKKCLLPVAMLASFTLAGCQSNADDHAADVYQTDQLNTKQETKTVNIISILPAKVAVDNSQNKRNAQAFGALIGAVAGGVIGHNVGSGSNSGTTAEIGRASCRERGGGEGDAGSWKKMRRRTIERPGEAT